MSAPVQSGEVCASESGAVKSCAATRQAALSATGFLDLDTSEIPKPEATSVVTVAERGG
jgi:hypothetical protein